jgi:hypothetical protein
MIGNFFYLKNLTAKNKNNPNKIDDPVNINDSIPYYDLASLKKNFGIPPS